MSYVFPLQSRSVHCGPSLLSPAGALRYSSGRLVVGAVSGQLQLWGVTTEGCPPPVSQEAVLELDSSIFSLAFDQQMKLVRILLSLAIMGRGGGG